MKKLTAKTLFIIIALVFIIIKSAGFAFAGGTPSKKIKLETVLTYHGKKFVVENFKRDKTLVNLCPFNNYSSFYRSKDWGWFYGQNCKWINVKSLIFRKINPSKPENHFIRRSATNPQYLNSLTAKQFKKYYLEMTETAVMRPTVKNIARYTYMTNFMREKSLQFSYAYYTYILNHPKYNIASQVGTTSWSYRETSNYSKEQKKRYIENKSNRIGLFFFFSGYCKYCMKQIPIINWFEADYHIVVMGVSKNYCPAGLKVKCSVSPFIFKKYHIKTVPELIMVYRRRDNSPVFQVIGSGLTPESTIADRIFFYIHSYKHVFEKGLNFQNIKGTPYLGKGE